MSDRDSYGLGRAELLDIYRALVVTRTAEERLEALHAQGHVTGELFRSLGQEAGAVGAAFALRRRTDGAGDVLAPTIRAAGALFLFGGEVIDFFRQYMGRGTSPTRGREASVHWFDFQKGFVGPVSPLGTMVEVMAGIALSFRLRGEERIGLVFDGDGASSTGAWHEGLNFAAAQRCPMILVVENNQWAFSTPTSKNTRVKSFTEKGPGYGIGSESVDGTDVLAVFDAVRRAATRVRSGEGTRLVELRYFRRKGHTQRDPHDYVDPAILAEWENKDPITLYRARMIQNGWASADELESIDAEEFDRCRAAAEQAVGEALPEASDALLDVYTAADASRPWTRADNPDPALA
jgi:pyruvate dehydrogenase E1 component alpha subunit/2-oxoisovalerate dehydrogenase E1 component alpha subunit